MTILSVDQTKRLLDLISSSVTVSKTRLWEVIQKYFEEQLDIKASQLPILKASIQEHSDKLGLDAKTAGLVASVMPKTLLKDFKELTSKLGVDDRAKYLEDSSVEAAVFKTKPEDLIEMVQGLTNHAMYNKFDNYKSSQEEKIKQGMIDIINENPEKWTNSYFGEQYLNQTLASLLSKLVGEYKSRTEASVLSKVLAETDLPTWKEEVGIMLVADRVASETEDKDSEYYKYHDTFSRPQMDIVELYQSEAEDAGIDVLNYLPLTELNKLEEEFNKVAGGKLTIEELWDLSEKAVYHYALQAVGHGVGIRDDKDDEDLLIEKGIDPKAFKGSFLHEGGYSEALEFLAAFDAKKSEDNEDSSEASVTAGKGSKFYGQVGDFFYIMKVDGVDTDKLQGNLPDQLEELKKLKNFKSNAQKDYIRTKGKDAKKAVDAWVKEFGPTQYAVQWYKTDKDDSLEVYYIGKAEASVLSKVLAQTDTDLYQWVQDSMDDMEIGILDLDGFDDFFSSLDVASAYEQWDTGESLEEVKEKLKVIYKEMEQEAMSKVQSAKVTIYYIWYKEDKKDDWKKGSLMTTTSEDDVKKFKEDAAKKAKKRGWAEYKVLPEGKDPVEASVLSKVLAKMSSLSINTDPSKGATITLDKEEFTKWNDLENDTDERILNAIESDLETWFGNTGFGWVAPEFVGALTDAPMFGDVETADNDHTDIKKIHELYWYPSYMVSDWRQELLEKGTVFFPTAHDPKEETVETSYPTLARVMASTKKIGNLENDEAVEVTPA